MTIMTTARVFSGLLSNLVVADGIAAGSLTHSFRERERTTPIQIAADVLVKIGTPSEGETALYGEIRDGVLVVLGPDLRRRTLAAARPRGEMGPPAPQTIEVEVMSLVQHTAKTTGKPYIKGSLKHEGVVKTYLVRGELAETFEDHGELDAERDVHAPFYKRLRAVQVGDVVEVLDILPWEAKAPKRVLTREQKDARNASARARRAAKKGPVNG
jgi:hypothetical protein